MPWSARASSTRFWLADGVPRAGLITLCSGDDPNANIGPVLERVREAATEGAAFVLTPEVTNCVSGSRARQIDVLRHEADDPMLAALREAASAHSIWLLIGSLALKTSDEDGRFANRSFLIAPDGNIAARYDKIHMFDVTVSETESYRESAGYRPGDAAVVVDTPVGRIGMSICYDLRFPYLYRTLAQAGAEILTVPSAFTPATGKAHWETLLRARAIENGAFVFAPAQTGVHPTSTDRTRSTYGHSLAVGPWGDVLADAGEVTGVTMVDYDLDTVRATRGKIPSLTHDRDFRRPT